MSSAPGPRGGRGGRQALVVLAASAVVAAGCAGVPDSSPAQVVGSIPNTPGPPEARQYLDINPEPGAGQRQIVNGFFKAQPNPESGHAVARQFLTAEAAKSWNPDALVRIVDEQQFYVSPPDKDSNVKVQVQQLGVLDGNGTYRSIAASEDSAVAYNLHLVQENGQWRISDPPTGLILDKQNFDFGYTAYELHFLAPNRTRLVREPRYYPSTFSTAALATLMLKGLLAGPSEALAGAVTSPVSDTKVRMAGNVVQDKSTSALRVNLSGLRAMGDLERRAAAAQIVWTLSRVGTTGIELYDDGQPLNFDDVTRPSQPNDWQSFSPDGPGVGVTGYYLADGAVHTTVDGKPLEGPAGEDNYRLVSIAVSLPDGRENRQRLAGVGRIQGGQRLYLGPIDGELEPVLQATSLTAPTFDVVSGDLWTVQAGRLVTRVTPGGVSISVAAPQLAELGPVRELRLSRDGTRVAVVAGDRDHTRLYVGRVVRDQGNVAVDAFVDTAVSLDNVIDADWASGTRLLVAGDDRDNPALKTISVDGARETSDTRDGLPGPVTDVAAGPNVSSLAVSGETLWQKAGDGWVEMLRDRPVVGTAPVYPG